MSWNEVGNNGKIDFCKFSPGVTKVRVLDGEPFSRWQHWIPSAGRSITCLGKGCPFCEVIKQAKANGEEPKFSQRKTHIMHVLNRTTKNIEILEQGNNFFEDLKMLHSDEGDIRNYDVKVRKSGSGTSTKYRIDKDDVVDLTEEEIALYEANKKNFAEHFAAPTQEQALDLIAGKDAKEVFQKNNIELA